MTASTLPTLIDLLAHNAVAHANRLAVIDDGVPCTHAMLYEAVQRQAAALSVLGVGRGDRVVLRTATGEVMAKQLARRSAKRIELKSLNPEHRDRSFDLMEVAWMHRVIWASQ